MPPKDIPPPKEFSSGNYPQGPFDRYDLIDPPEPPDEGDLIEDQKKERESGANREARIAAEVLAGFAGDIKAERARQCFSQAKLAAAAHMAVVDGQRR